MSDSYSLTDTDEGFVTDPDSFAEREDEIRRTVAERAYELFEEREGDPDGDMQRDWFQAESELLEKVPVEMRETEDSYEIEAQLPEGFSLDDIELAVQPDTLAIQGHTGRRNEEKSGDEQIVYSELQTRDIWREISLPESVEPDEVDFEMDGSQLHIHLPRKG